MDVVGVRLVQSKQEQHVWHGAVHLHSYILPLNDNIPPISVSMSSIAAQRSLTCLGLTATYAAVCQKPRPRLHSPTVYRATKRRQKCGAMHRTYVCTESPTATGPDACWENVGVGMPDGHVSDTIDWTQDGLKEKQDRTVQIMSWLEVYSETRDVYLKQEQRYEEMYRTALFSIGTSCFMLRFVLVKVKFGPNFSLFWLTSIHTDPTPYVP